MAKREDPLAPIRALVWATLLALPFWMAVTMLIRSCTRQR